MAATQSMSRKGGTIQADDSASHERTRASNGKVPGFLQYRNSAGDASLGTGAHQTSTNSLERYKLELKEQKPKRTVVGQAKNYSKGLKTYLGTNKPINMSRHEQVKSIMNDWYAHQETSKSSSLLAKSKRHAPYREGNGLPLHANTSKGPRAKPLYKNQSQHSDVTGRYGTNSQEDLHGKNGTSVENASQSSRSRVQQEGLQPIHKNVAPLMNESRGVNLKGQFNGHTSGTEMRYQNIDENSIRVRRGPGSQLNSIHQKNGESIMNSSQNKLSGAGKNTSSQNALMNYQNKHSMPPNTRGSLREAYSMHQMPDQAAQLKRDSAMAGDNLDLANINAANPNLLSTQQPSAQASDRLKFNSKKQSS